MALEQVTAVYGDSVPPVIVVAGENWHVGVIGIVAAKLAQEFNRPAAVMSVTDGMANASARAVPGFNWHKALFEARDLFDRWGGHANAAGFSLPENKIQELRERLLVSAQEQGYTGGSEKDSSPCSFDIQVALGELAMQSGEKQGMNVLDYFDQMEPFSGNFPYPTMRSENVVVHRVRELRGGHLQMELSQAGSPNFAAIGFGLRKCKSLIAKSRKVNIVFEPTWNYYNGRRTLQLCIKSIE